MIKSMTGFGRSEAAVSIGKITVEVRSLNGKQLDLSVRLPYQFRPLEYDVRSMVARELVRGKIEVTASLEAQSSGSPAEIDEELFSSYYRQITTLAIRNGADLSGQDAQMVSTALRMPEVISVHDDSLSDSDREIFLGAVAQAVRALDAFRIQEGRILIEDLLRRVELIRDYKRQIEPFEAARTQTIRQRMLEAIEAASLVPDNNRLEQEMIFWIEKLDITEEKVRLENHCNYFRQTADTEDGAGRKLGFIAQEMGREINTMGSKSNQSDMQILVVKMKDELEKIKEQVLNIL